MGRAWRKVVNAPVPPKYEEGKLVSVLLDSQIARQPAETEIFARRLGATPFEPRAIECVYRVRERTYWGNDCCIIIAYPIWIAVA